MRSIVTSRVNVFLINLLFWLIPRSPQFYAVILTVFDGSLDRAGSAVGDVFRESTLALTRLFDACFVVDIWRCLHPVASGFT